MEKQDKSPAIKSKNGRAAVKYRGMKIQSRKTPKQKYTGAVKNNVYELDEENYSTGGGIFYPMPHYEAMFAKK